MTPTSFKMFKKQINQSECGVLHSSFGPVGKLQLIYFTLCIFQDLQLYKFFKDFHNN